MTARQSFEAALAQVLRDRFDVKGGRLRRLRGPEKHLSLAELTRQTEVAIADRLKGAGKQGKAS